MKIVNQDLDTVEKIYVKPTKSIQNELEKVRQLSNKVNMY